MLKDVKGDPTPSNVHPVGGNGFGADETDISAL
jgi:hypothetical protein